MDELRAELASANAQVASLGAQLADAQEQKAELAAQLEAISGVASGRRLSQGGGSPAAALRTPSSPASAGRERREDTERRAEREEKERLRAQNRLPSP